MENPKFIHSKFTEQSWKCVLAEINAIIPISGLYEFGEYEYVRDGGTLLMNYIWSWHLYLPP